MSRIALTSSTDLQAAFAVVRETFTSRDYHWEPHGALEAVAHQGGRPIKDTPTSRTLRVNVRVDQQKGHIVLKQETNSAALAGAGVPVFMIWLNIRFAKIVRAVRDDLTAAGHR